MEQPAEHPGIQGAQETPLPRRYDVKRSCILCHERKVRCDKAVPCSRCIRAQASCRYPGPERIKRRPPQRGVTAQVGHRLGALENVVPRLEALERAIVATCQTNPSGIDTLATEARKSQPASAPASADTEMQGGAGIPSTPREHSQGFLVKEGTSSRYIDEVLFSRVLEKESDLQSANDNLEGTDSISATSPALILDCLMSDTRPSTDISSLYPSRRQATQLWQTYLNNVDPLLKLFHVPTTQAVVFAAINNPKQVSLDVSALLFSIYFAAVTSLGSPDSHIMLGKDRRSALHQFKRGLELSLHLASFLDAPTITSLQAVSIYLICHRNHSGGRSGWVLNGLLLRAAQSIGLHRDGEHFHLPPLECEIRRRLWWMILGSDARVAEDHGIMTSGFDGFSDTKLPLNIDDWDLWPDMKEAPASKPRWTEMTMFLVLAEMNLAIQQVSRLSIAGWKGSEEVNSLERLLESTKERVEGRYLEHCDPNIPVQKAAYSLGRIMLGKLELFIRQQYLRGLSAEGFAAKATEQTLSLSCDVMETGIRVKTDDLLANFQWLFSTYTQYHVLTYVLWYLCVRPDVPGAGRAWELVDKTFTIMEKPGWPNPGSKWNVIRKLREKALDRRHSPSSAPPTRDPAPADSALPQSSGMPLDGVGDIPNVLTFGDGVAWDTDSIWFPDWVGYSSGFGF